MTSSTAELKPVRKIKVTCGRLFNPANPNTQATSNNSGSSSGGVNNAAQVNFVISEKPKLKALNENRQKLKLKEKNGSEPGVTFSVRILIIHISPGKRSIKLNSR